MAGDTGRWSGWERLGRGPLQVDSEVELALFDQPDVADVFALMDAGRDYLREWLGWLDEMQQVGQLAEKMQDMRVGFALEVGAVFVVRHHGKVVGVASYQDVDRQACITRYRDGRGGAQDPGSGLERGCWPASWPGFEADIAGAASDARQRAIPARPPQQGRVALGYWLGEEAQGHGVVTRVCRFLSQYALEALGLGEVQIRVAEENKKSRAIPERLGFRIVGRAQAAEWLYDRYVDHVIYSLVDTEALRAAERPYPLNKPI